MDAQGALDSVLGRLAAVLVNEAQLLGGVRGDVEFIKDEMESMNGLLLHLTEAQHRDHQVRAWMKQVAGLTRDCEGNVELYVHYVGRGGSSSGVLAFLRRIPFLLRTILIRRRIATRIRELKVRARDVGDRRLRYGVTVPDLAAADVADTYDDGDVQSPRDAAGVEEDRRRRSALLDGDEPRDDEELVTETIDSLVKWLSEEPPPATAGDGQPQQQLRFFPVLGYRLAKLVAQGVYEHSSVATSFDCKAFVTSDYTSLRRFLVNILDQVTVLHEPQQEDKPRNQQEQLVDKDEEQLVDILQAHLKDKRFLMVLADVTREQQWKTIVDALLHAADGCHPGSAIVTTTDIEQVAKCPSPNRIINAKNLEEFYAGKADRLNANYTYWDDTYGQRMSIFDAICYPNAYAMKMFLHLLYVNPNRTSDELRKYGSAIFECKRLNKSIAKQVLTFCYNELPSKYRSCLLYLTIFPKGRVIRASSLARRWIAEGFITTTATTRTDEKVSLMDEACHYLDVLFTRGFISLSEISVTGKIKSFTVHHEVCEVIAKIARDVNFVDANLPADLANHLSIHNRIGLQESHSNDNSIDILAFLPILASSPQWQLLKLLDLEGCKGLKKHHLKSICKILLLKYLSLRNTDTTELPEQIKELQCLESLDIRQTKVRMLAKKVVVLPLLKYFLAGHKVPSSNGARISSEELFPMVRIPICIQRMKNLEILSHVQVLNGHKELSGITQLLKLRKLGVSIYGENAKLNNLFHLIEKLQRCLRSLSIRIDRPADPGNQNHDAGIPDALPILPRFIKNLNISGITTGFSHLIQEHPQLSKVTLSETYLNKDDLCIIGNLPSLRCLKLQHKSYTETELAFKEYEFQSLNFLLVEGSGITYVSFISGSCPNLERFVWSFTALDALSGVCHLTELKKLELNGDCNLELVKEETVRHPCYPYYPILKHNPHHQRKEDETAVTASSSSAP